MLTRVEPPGATENPELTEGVYKGLQALIDFHREKGAELDVHFWTLVVAKLRRVDVADRALAYAIASGLYDGLAYQYDVQGWRDVAEGWRETSRVVRDRADARRDA